MSFFRHVLRNLGDEVVEFTGLLNVDVGVSAEWVLHGLYAVDAYLAVCLRVSVFF